MGDRTEQIVAIHMRAAELQKACKWMPEENFFPNMIGHMALVFGPDLAAEILTMFEITRQEHEEMLDDMCGDEERAARAVRDGLKNWLSKGGD